MTAERREAVLRALWPDGAGRGASVWAVLDGARDPAIHAALVESRLEFRCLYAGRLPRLLELNAPQLVELVPTNRLTLRWIDEGWGRAWGVFIRIADPSNLRHHLRKNLLAQDEDGHRLLFRWYDPRVLRTYLPTCTADEARRFFGPAEAFATEDADGGLRTWRLAELLRPPARPAA